MKFGDVLFSESRDRKYRVLNMNGEFIEAGEWDADVDDDPDGNCHVWKTLQLTIPYEICKYLDNAVAFYQCDPDKSNNIDNNQPWQTFRNSYGMFGSGDFEKFCLELRHDDEWIIKHFNGPLNESYLRIGFEYRWNRFVVLIEFSENHSHAFPTTNEITNLEVDEFYRIRLDKDLSP